MNDLLTTRQVQDILKIDRITVYRMLQDGRLKGVKIGQQWRFPQSEVERLVAGEPPETRPSPACVDPIFPTHCVQTIQDLFSEVGQIGAIALDVRGQAVTEFSQPGELYRLFLDSGVARELVRQTWISFVNQALGGAREFTDPAGLTFTGSPIHDRGGFAGLFLAGPFRWQSPDPDDQARLLLALGQSLSMPLDRLQAAARQVRVIAPQQQEQVRAWPASAARAIQSILVERTGFMDRLQKIADLSQLA